MFTMERTLILESAPSTCGPNDPAVNTDTGNGSLEMEVPDSECTSVEKPFIKEEPELEIREFQEAGTTSDDEPIDIKVDFNNSNDCPSTLRHCTEDEISNAFKKCYHKCSILPPLRKNSLAGKVYTALTGKKTSTWKERDYLHGLWTMKYKDILCTKRNTKTSKSRQRKNNRILAAQALLERMEEAVRSYEVTMMETIDMQPTPSTSTFRPLQMCTEDEIRNAFQRCYKKQLSVNASKPNSLFGNVFTFLTGNGTSTDVERYYLQKLWNTKYKIISEVAPPVRARPSTHKKGILIQQRKGKLSKLTRRKRREELEKKGLIRPLFIVDPSLVPIPEKEKTPKRILSTEESTKIYRLNRQRQNYLARSRRRIVRERKLQNSIMQKLRGTKPTTEASDLVFKGKGASHQKLAKLKEEDSIHSLRYPLSWESYLKAHSKHNCVGSPKVGGGTFENPHCTLRNNNDQRDSLLLYCICPACGDTFPSLEELTTHKDAVHVLVAPTCKICSEPIIKRSIYLPNTRAVDVLMDIHILKHCNQSELEVHYQKQTEEVGMRIGLRKAALYKCLYCSIVVISSLALDVHKAEAHSQEYSKEREALRRKLEKRKIRQLALRDSGNEKHVNCLTNELERRLKLRRNKWKSLMETLPRPHGETYLEYVQKRLQRENEQLKSNACNKRKSLADTGKHCDESRRHRPSKADRKSEFQSKQIKAKQKPIDTSTTNSDPGSTSLQLASKQQVAAATIDEVDTTKQSRVSGLKLKRKYDGSENEDDDNSSISETDDRCDDELDLALSLSSKMPFWQDEKITKNRDPKLRGTPIVRVIRLEPTDICRPYRIDEGMSSKNTQIYHRHCKNEEGESTDQSTPSPKVSSGALDPDVVRQSMKTHLIRESPNNESVTKPITRRNTRSKSGKQPLKFKSKRSSVKTNTDFDNAHVLTDCSDKDNSDACGTSSEGPCEIRTDTVHPCKPNLINPPIKRGRGRPRIHPPKVRLYKRPRLKTEEQRERSRVKAKEYRRIWDQNNRKASRRKSKRKKYAFAIDKEHIDGSSRNRYGPRMQMEDISANETNSNTCVVSQGLLRTTVNYKKMGVWPGRKDAKPLPLEIFIKSHQQHTAYVVSNELLLENITNEDSTLQLLEKTSPAAGKGTFFNPFWTKNDDVIVCVCPACGDTFKNVDMLLHHRDRTHNDYCGVCEFCSKPIQMSFTILQHASLHLSPIELDQLYTREIKKLGEPPTTSTHRLYKCKQCNKIFTGSRTLRHHIECMHNQRKIAECSICRRPISEQYLPFHLRTHLSFEEQKQYMLQRKEEFKDIKMNRQAESTPKESRLEQLQRMLDAREAALLDRRDRGQSEKTMEKVEISKGNYTKRAGNYGPVQCSQCGKIFSTVYRLIAHEQIVHGLGTDKVAKCSVCARPFGQKSQLRVHMTTHLNLEERTLFVTWPGEIEEFIERLNTGEDLAKPPVHKEISGRRGRKRKGGEQAPVRRIPKKIGRPRKHHHLYEKQCDNISNSETAANCWDEANILNYINSRDARNDKNEGEFSLEVTPRWT